MTLYYDYDEDALAENTPDDYVEYDDEGRLLFDLSSPQKRDALRDAVERAELAHEPGVDPGDLVTFADADSVKYRAVVTKVHNENCVDVVYPVDSELRHATSVPADMPQRTGYFWYV